MTTTCITYENGYLVSTSMFFCKPSRKAGALYLQAIGKGQASQLWSLHLKEDLLILIRWTPPSYWNEFWSLPAKLFDPFIIYRVIQQKPDRHAFVALIDEQLACLIDSLFQRDK